MALYTFESLLDFFNGPDGQNHVETH